VESGLFPQQAQRLGIADRKANALVKGRSISIEVCCGTPEVDH
jgi:hypothetical protein